MSEFQYIHFQAVDRPLDDEQLAYMERQSTRAEVSRWAFSNEYHFGDFRGDPYEMLRRGYDVHLRYANFGVRRLMFRLPAGLPWPAKTFNEYLVEYAIEWRADREGPGGILEIQPEGDAGLYDEDFFDFDRLEGVLGGVRAMLMAGDLRPLYLAWLACIDDEEEALEPPVPAGLGELPPELAVIADFYALSHDLIGAAAVTAPPAPEVEDRNEQVRKWVRRRSKDELRDLVTRMLSDPSPGVRTETLARIRDEWPTATWPTARPSRTLGGLKEAAEGVQKERLERERRERERAREARLKAIAADPKKAVAKAKRLVQERSRESYALAAQELADLREALGPKRGPGRAQKVAEQLVEANPTLRLLKSALRKHDLLPGR